MWGAVHDSEPTPQELYVVQMRFKRNVSHVPSLTSYMNLYFCNAVGQVRDACKVHLDDIETLRHAIIDQFFVDPRFAVFRFTGTAAAYADGHATAALAHMLDLEVQAIGSTPTPQDTFIVELHKCVGSVGLSSDDDMITDADMKTVAGMADDPDRLRDAVVALQQRQTSTLTQAARLQAMVVETQLKAHLPRLAQTQWGTKEHSLYAQQVCTLLWRDARPSSPITTAMTDKTWKTARAQWLVGQNFDNPYEECFRIMELNVLQTYCGVSIPKTADTVSPQCAHIQTLAPGLFNAMRFRATRVLGRWWETERKFGAKDTGICAPLARMLRLEQIAAALAPDQLDTTQYQSYVALCIQVATSKLKTCDSATELPDLMQVDPGFGADDALWNHIRALTLRQMAPHVSIDTARELEADIFQQLAEHLHGASADKSMLDAYTWLYAAGAGVQRV